MKQPKMVKSQHPDLLLRFLINGLSTVVVALLIFFASYPPMKWLYTCAVAAICSVALWEYYNLVKKKLLFPGVVLGIVFGVLYVLASFARTQNFSNELKFIFQNVPIIVLGLAFFGCFVQYAFERHSPILNIATTFLGIIYIAIPLGLLVRIMFFFDTEYKIDEKFLGSWWVIYLIAVTKVADMGGYFIGRRFGRHKLALRLSPNKTIEGFIGGLLASILLSLLICFVGKKWGSVFENLNFVQFFFLGFIIGILGQLGDLAESLLKRDAKVKDSNAIPAVGGILDMIDSILFTAPAVYIFLKMLYT